MPVVVAVDEGELDGLESGQDFEAEADLEVERVGVLPPQLADVELRLGIDRVELRPMCLRVLEQRPCRPTLIGADLEQGLRLQRVDQRLEHVLPKSKHRGARQALRLLSGPGHQLRHDIAIGAA